MASSLTLAQEELFGTRNRSYSAWHRRRSTGRFVGIESAQTLAMIDLDASLYVEYDDGTKEPLALIETAEDRGQRIKPATVTRNLARRCRPPIPAYVLLYTLSDQMNPADEEWNDIKSFRVMRIWPYPETLWRCYSPQEWAENLVKLRVWAGRKLDSQFLGWMDS
jgi:hypothetical protein